MIRIVLADDHTIVREGLKQLLAAAGDLEVIAEARDGHEAMQRVRELDFDVLLLDMSMPGKSGIELVKQVHGEKPKLRILVLSMHEEQQYAVRAIRAGAAGYLTKEGASAELVAAIRKVAGGGAYISSAVAEQLALGAMPGAKCKTILCCHREAHGLAAYLSNGRTATRNVVPAPIRPAAAATTRIHPACVPRPGHK